MVAGGASGDDGSALPSVSARETKAESIGIADIAAPSGVRALNHHVSITAANAGAQLLDFDLEVDAVSFGEGIERGVSPGVAEAVSEPVVVAAIAVLPAMVSGTVQAVAGDVKIVSEDGTCRMALQGDQVRSDETVVVGADGSIRLELEDGRIVDVERDSPLGRIAEAPDTSLDIGPVAAVDPLSDFVPVPIAQAPDEFPMMQAGLEIRSPEAQGGVYRAPLLLDQPDTAGEVISGFPTADGATAYPALEVELFPTDSAPFANAPASRNADPMIGPSEPALQTEHAETPLSVQDVLDDPRATEDVTFPSTGEGEPANAGRSQEGGSGSRPDGAWTTTEIAVTGLVTHPDILGPVIAVEHRADLV